MKSQVSHRFLRCFLYSDVSLPFRKALILRALHAPGLNYWLFASQIPESSNSCFPLLFSLTIMLCLHHIKILPRLQDLSSNVSTSLTFWNFPWHPQSGNASPSPLSPHRIQVNIHLSYAISISRSVLTSRYIKTSKTQFFSNNE